MNTRYYRIIQHAVLGLDLLTLNLLVIALQLGLHRMDESYTVAYSRFWIGLNVSWLFVSWVGNLYQEKYIVSFERFSRRTVRLYLYWLVLLMLYLFFARQYELSRLYISILLAGQGIMLLTNRFIYLGVRTYFKQSPSLVRQVMIIGFNEQAKKLATYLEAEGMNTKIVGFCEEEENVQELSHYPILSSIERAMDIAKAHKVSDIYSTIAPEHDLGIYQLMDEADRACIHFRLIPDLSFFIKQSVHIRYLRDMPVLTVRDEPLMDAGNRIRKRLFDIVISALVVLFILSWLVPLIALLILIESRGPVFFVQQRTGRNNESFGCLKFRSMRVNKDSHLKQATRGDSRITKVGAFLRRTSLDEFPQFINVLKGEMSLVGPRPHMLKHTDDYSKLISHYMVRQFLKPGITGWAQVNGYRGETRTLEQMKGRVEHDIWYLENWGLWLDVRIMLLTAYKALKGDQQAF